MAASFEEEAGAPVPSLCGGPSLPGLVMGRRALAGAAKPAGVALAFEEGSFFVRVSDDAGAVLISLGPYPEEEVVAVWRSLAAASGLPLLIAGPDGELQQPYRQLGRVVLGDAIAPGRLKVLSGRRPRFLVRRKPARLPRRPFIHREREIATGGAG